MPKEFPAELNQSLAEIFTRLRDTSVRDGQQSWDANRWRLEDILPVLSELNTLAVTLRDHYGHELAPVEVWGGGQVMQPAKFNGENPFANLRAMRKAAPDLVMQDLYRGRQCYAMEPVSGEVQYAATYAAARDGIHVHRVFDMMNDIDNLKVGIEAGLDAGMRVEGAISYVSEPDDGRERAWTFENYADFAIELAEAGCHEIAIKDYAGLLIDPSETEELVKTIRRKLDAAGHTTMPINLHSHGQKPEVLKAAMDAGCHKVDVGIGALSEGSAHTNMRSMIELLMQEKGFSREEYADHPLMQQLGRVEYIINQMAKIHQPYRLPESAQPTAEQVAKYRIAGGAISAQWRTIAKEYDGFATELENHGCSPIPAEQLFLNHLELMPSLWEKAGRFNTVTPGAFILGQQALKHARLMAKGITPQGISCYTDEYKGIVMGRYGRNRGMEKGLGDDHMLNQFLLEDAGKELFEIKNDDIRADLLKAAGLGNEKTATHQLRQTIDALDAEQAAAALKRLHMALDAQITHAEGPQRERLERVRAASRPGRSEPPATTLEQFRQQVEHWEMETPSGKQTVAQLAEVGALPMPLEELTLLAALLREKGSTKNTENLIATMVTGRVHGPNIEPKRSKDIEQLGLHLDRELVVPMRRCRAGSEVAIAKVMDTVRGRGYPDDGLPVNSAERLKAAIIEMSERMPGLKSALKPEIIAATRGTGPGLVARG